MTAVPATAAYTRTQRLTLLACILGSSAAFLDGTIVNVALPAIRASLHGGLGTQEWVVDAYLLTLGSLLLVGGSLGDVFGRRRIFVIGVVGFGIASLVCAARAGRGGADRRTSGTGDHRRDARAEQPGADHGHVLQNISGPRRSAPGPPGPESRPWPGRCSAACWSRSARGAGCSSSTCRWCW